MQYVISQLVVNNKKSCIRTLEKLLELQNNSVEMMLDVVKSDCQNKLEINRILGPPKLEEWKSVYTQMGWEYIEAKQEFVDPVPRTLSPLFSKSGKEIFSNKDKSKQYHSNAYYDEMVSNYETYLFCKSEFHQTTEILRRIEPTPNHLDLLDYEYIEHDEALCFLLGINTNLPTSLDLSNEKLITVFNYEDEALDVNVNNFLFKIKTNKKLVRKFGTPTINTKEFIEWALEQGYIEEANKEYQRNQRKSPYEQEFSKLLYKELKERGLISGEYIEKWLWQSSWNSLHYFVKELWSNTLPREWYARNPKKDPQVSQGPEWGAGGIMHYFFYDEKTDIRLQRPGGEVDREVEIDNVVEALLHQVNDPHGRKE